MVVKKLIRPTPTLPIIDTAVELSPEFFNIRVLNCKIELMPVSWLRQAIESAIRKGSKYCFLLRCFKKDLIEMINLTYEFEREDKN